MALIRAIYTPSHTWVSAYSRPTADNQIMQLSLTCGTCDNRACRVHTTSGRVSPTVMSAPPEPRLTVAPSVEPGPCCAIMPLPASGPFATLHAGKSKEIYDWQG